MKILWLSNVVLSNEPTKTSGGWISDMWRAIIKQDNIEIYNFALTTSKKEEKTSFNKTTQWTFSRNNINNVIKPGTKYNNKILSLIHEISPDIIHIWGVETEWSILYLNSLYKLYKERTLLEIQGLMFVYSEFFFNGLSLFPITKVTGILDFIFPKMSAIYNYFYFKRIGKYERDILSKAKYINTQSNYVRDLLTTCTNTSKILQTGIILRKEFLNAEKIKSPLQIKNVCTVTSRATFKGLHITLKAFAIAHSVYPDIRLKIIGVNVFKYVNFGYVSYLKRLAKRLNIDDAIDWMGYLDAKQILEVYGDSSCYINSSFIETYCLSLAEALTAGMPCVVSESGAMVELAINNETALTFPMTDFNAAACKLLSIIENEQIRDRLSKTAYSFMKERNNKDKICYNQIETYKYILKNL